jgi:hypothetical protein
MSASENAIGCHPVSGLKGPAKSPYPLSAASRGCACRATECEGEWNARRHPSHTCKHVLPGKGWRETSVWRKIHIAIDEETLEIRAVHCRQAIAKQSAERDVTSSCIGDPPMLPNLLGQIAPDQKIGSVTAPSHACKHGIVRQWMGRMIRGFARSGLN